ncbi:MAG: DEAD/DEAH box helicase [Rikenellaceae bacterium]
MLFDDTELNDEILDAIYEMGFEEMTPVQEQTIPIILQGDDLIGCAQTGTGKTAAFALPLLSRLVSAREVGGYDDSKIKSIIMVPTRELAMQIDTQFQGFSYYLPISTTVVYGGGDGKTWDIQRQGLVKGADIVIATPGRLLAHLESGQIDLSKVECFILDEADRMLDMGFFDDIMKVVKQMPESRQTILFSATLPTKIRQLSKQILRSPKEINIAISKPSESIEQGVYICYESQKMSIVSSLFDNREKDEQLKTIIFSSSKLKVKELAHTIKRLKISSAAMHSDLGQAQREEVMLAFKSNKVNILVATDIVARGIDIDDIDLVINYDVPHDPEDYIHRIGRTGRASATGRAITFINEKEQGKWRRIEDFLEKEVPRLTIPEELGGAPTYNPDAAPKGGGRGRTSGKGFGSKGGSKRLSSSAKRATSGEKKVAESNPKPTQESTPKEESSNQPKSNPKRGKGFWQKRKKRPSEPNS